jgi:hypothetical protein
MGENISNRYFRIPLIIFGSTSILELFLFLFSTLIVPLFFDFNFGFYELFYRITNFISAFLIPSAIILNILLIIILNFSQKGPDGNLKIFSIALICAFLFNIAALFIQFFRVRIMVFYASIPDLLIHYSFIPYIITGGIESASNLALIFIWAFFQSNFAQRNPRIQNSKIVLIIGYSLLIISFFFYIPYAMTVFGSSEIITLIGIFGFMLFSSAGNILLIIGYFTLAKRIQFTQHQYLTPEPILDNTYDSQINPPYNPTKLQISSSSNNFCGNCGNSLPLGVKYCPFCGNSTSKFKTQN